MLSSSAHMIVPRQNRTGGGSKPDFCWRMWCVDSAQCILVENARNALRDLEVGSLQSMQAEWRKRLEDLTNKARIQHVRGCLQKLHRRIASLRAAKDGDAPASASYNGKRRNAWRSRCTRSLVEQGVARPRQVRRQWMRAMLLLSLLPSSCVGLRAQPTLETRPSAGRGLGVYALSPIPEGDFVCYYEGEQLSLAQVEQRYPMGVADYLFQIEDDFYVDGANSNHVSRYINHQELGNLAVSIEESRLAFHALCEIPQGDELTFDYGLDYWLDRPSPMPKPRHLHR